MKGVTSFLNPGDGRPTKKTQRNFTDPDSHLMQSGGTYLQGYNCQLAVDSVHQVIVSVGVRGRCEPSGPRLRAWTGSRKLLRIAIHFIAWAIGE